MPCLYEILSTVGKRYIGISKHDVDYRWSLHLKRMKDGDRRPMYRAMRRDGANTFSRRTLVISDDWSYLRLLERRAVAAYGSTHPAGYNLTLGGEDVMHHTPETKAKASLSHCAIWARDDGTRRSDMRGVNAMRVALADPDKELARRQKISTTMRMLGIGRGASNGYARLSDDDICAMRTLFGKQTDMSIAAAFGVSRSLISAIRLGKRWGMV